MTPTPLRTRPLIAVLACTLAACTGQQSGPVAPQGVMGRPVVAFLGHTGVGVADENGNVARLATFTPISRPRPPESDIWTLGLAWSRDGKRLSWVRAGTVYLAEPGTGGQWSWACGCVGAGFIGDTLVSVSTDATALYRYEPSAATPQRTPLKWAPASRYTAKFLAGGAKRAIIAIIDYQQAAAYGGPAALSLVDIDGTVTAVDGGVTNVPASFGKVSPAGTKVAFGLIDHNGYCANYGFIAVVDLATGQVQTPDPPGKDRPWYVLGYDWSTDGSLTASFAQAPVCRSVEGTDGQAVAGALARLDGTLWRVTWGRWSR